MIDEEIIIYLAQSICGINENGNKYADVKIVSYEGSNTDHKREHVVKDLMIWLDSFKDVDNNHDHYFDYDYTGVISICTDNDIYFKMNY